MFVANRIQFVAYPPAAADADSVYLLIGTDAGIPRPSNDIQEGGARADVVVVARVHEGVGSFVVIPRDLVVIDQNGVPVRLALTMKDGASAVADALCTNLGISVDHIVAVDSVGFVGAVDALGGVSVNVPFPVKDTEAGLLITEAGTHTLTGQQTLALVRSRHPQYLIDEEWRGVSEEDGTRARTASTSTVADALSEALQRAAALQLLAATWEASNGITVSTGTNPWEVVSLLKTLDAPLVLPTQPIGPGYETAANEASLALEDAGFTLACADR